jgi:hypothetical protein
MLNVLFRRPQRLSSCSSGKNIRCRTGNGTRIFRRCRSVGVCDSSRYRDSAWAANRSSRGSEGRRTVCIRIVATRDLRHHPSSIAFVVPPTTTIYPIGDHRP